MDLRDYQLAAEETAIYGESVDTIMEEVDHAYIRSMLALHYPALKLNGEAGELAEEIAKAIRDDNGAITAGREAAIRKELGDVLWYCAAIATEMGWNLSYVAEDNLRKLQNRKARGVLGGSGNDR